MMQYSVQPRDRILVKRYGFLNIGKNVSKTLSGKYSQKLLDHAEQSATDALKTTSKGVIQKTAKATGNLIGKKIADRIMKVSKTLPQNNWETITNKHDKEIPKENYVSLEERRNCWWSEINLIV